MRFYLIILLFIWMTSPAFATTTTWQGGTDTNWSVATNWDNSVPTISDNATLNGTATNQTVISSSATAQNLTIPSNATLNITYGNSLTLSKNLNKAGRLYVNGSIINATFNNTLFNLTARNVEVLNTTTPPTNPASRYSLSSYINLTNFTTPSWAQVNLSYANTTYESNHKMYLYNYSSWNLLGTSTLNAAQHYDSVNSTSYGLFGLYQLNPQVSSCSILDEAGITYNQTVNLSGVVSGESYCVNISAGNITFDGKGYDISETFSFDTGIDIRNVLNVSVINAIVSNYSTNIYVKNVNNSIFDNITMNNTENPIGGINFDAHNTYNDNFTNSRYFGGKDGINFDYADNIIVYNNTFINLNVDSLYGVVVTNLTALNNSFSDSAGYAIDFLGGCNNNSFVNNTADSTEGFAFTGFTVATSSINNIIDGNNITNSSTYGIYLGNSFGNTMINNRIVNSSSYGIYINYNQSLIANNLATNSTLSDLYLSRTNNITNLTTQQTLLSGTFSYVYLKGVSNPPLDSAGIFNLSAYVNLTNISTTSWAFINLTYTNETAEANHRIYRYNNTDWLILDSAVNTIQNYVWKNITDFTYKYFGVFDNFSSIATTIASGTTSSGYISQTQGSITTATTPTASEVIKSSLPVSSVPARPGTYNITKEGVIILLEGNISNGEPQSGAVFIVGYPGSPFMVAGLRKIDPYTYPTIPTKTDYTTKIFTSYEISVTLGTGYFCMNYDNFANPNSVTVYEYENGWQELSADRVANNITRSLICGKVKNTPYMIAGFVAKEAEMPTIEQTTEQKSIETWTSIGIAIIIGFCVIYMIFKKIPKKKKR